MPQILNINKQPKQGNKWCILYKKCVKGFAVHCRWFQPTVYRKNQSALKQKKLSPKGKAF